MKTPSSRFGKLALLTLFVLILAAKLPARAATPAPDAARTGDAPSCEQLVLLPPTAVVVATADCATDVDYDQSAAAELVGNEYLFLADLLHVERAQSELMPGSMVARFDDVLPVWAPESVRVLSIAREAGEHPYRITVRTHSTGEIGYFEVQSLTDVGHFLALASTSRLVAH